MAEKAYHFIDISRKLEPGTAVWPGDTEYELNQNLAVSSGQAVNLSTITLSLHTGSHVDAPYHVDDRGAKINELDFEPYWGPAQVVTVSKLSGPLYPGDFLAYQLDLAPRLLVRSAASELDQTKFPEKFVYPSPELADYLGSFGMVLFGTDCPSMDEQHSKELEGHRALLRNNIAILEWLDLSLAADGLYDLAALPLNIVAGDGSPVRAVLRSLK